MAEYAERRTRILGNGQLFNVMCQTCGMGAIANSLKAAEELAVEHVRFKGDHTVHIAGRGLVTQIVNLQMLGEMVE